jgi:hypothetical protein
MCAGKGLSKFLVLTLLVAPARPLQHIAYVATADKLRSKRKRTMLNIYRNLSLHLSLVIGAQLVRLDRLCPPFS